MLTRNTKVTLTPEMMTFAHRLGDNRYARSRSASVYNNRKSSLPNEFIDRNGACGEVAIAVLLFSKGVISMQAFFNSVEMMRDDSIKSVYQGSDMGDLVLDNNKTIDVKTTHHVTGNLLIVGNKLRSNSIDMYVGCRGNYLSSHDFEFIGYQTAEWLRFNYRRGESYELFGSRSLLDFEFNYDYDERVIYELLYDDELWQDAPLSQEFKQRHLKKLEGEYSTKWLAAQVSLFEGCAWWERELMLSDED